MEVKVIMQLIFHYIDCIGCEETYTLSLLHKNFWNATLGGKKEFNVPLLSHADKIFSNLS